MKFVKGMLIGGMVVGGIALMCADGMCSNKKKMMKKGKQMIKKMGIV